MPKCKWQRSGSAATRAGIAHRNVVKAGIRHEASSHGRGELIRVDESGWQTGVVPIHHRVTGEIRAIDGKRQIRCPCQLRLRRERGKTGEQAVDCSSNVRRRSRGIVA